MKKLKTLSHITLLLFIAAVNLTYSQSDYNLVQDFKARYNEIEDLIKTAESLDECLQLSNEITAMRYSFEEHKTLLDKSLYPMDFNASFTNLSGMLEIRKRDFLHITQLQAEVDTLKERFAVLDKANISLIERINILEKDQIKNSKTIASLQQLTAQLKANIKQRDMLIVEVADSLFAGHVNHPFTLNDAEKMSLAQKVQYHNLFYNMEKTIDDHIQFLKISTIKPQDVADMKKEYTGFIMMWEKVGEKLADIYLVKKEKAERIEKINNKFAEWDTTLNNVMWAAVNKSFEEKNISLPEYNNGEEFANSVTDFINHQIEKANAADVEEVEETYYTFTDSVWNSKIEKEWVPILIENNMLTKADKDSIVSRLTVWKAQIIGDEFEWWVYAVGVLILIGIVMVSSNIFRKRASES